MHTVGDEDLGAVENPLVAVTHRVGANALYIGASTRLGHRQRAHRIAVDHLRQPLLLLFFCAVPRQVGRHNIRVNTETGGKAAETHARQLFNQHQGHMGRGARAAVGFVHVGTQQACGAEGAPQLAWHHVFFFPLLIVGRNFLFKGATRHVAKQGQFITLHCVYSNSGLGQ